MMKIECFQARIGAFLTPLPRYTMLLALLAAPLGCGEISLGGGSTNEPVPTGTVVAQGSFTSVASGKTVTGAVSVYVNTSGTFIVRLQGLNAPTESGLFVRGVVGAQTYDQALRYTTGNQNYTFSSVPTGSTWAQVKIYSAPKVLDYGLAALTQVNPTP